MLFFSSFHIDIAFPLVYVSATFDDIISFWYWYFIFLSFSLRLIFFFMIIFSYFSAFIYDSAIFIMIFRQISLFSRACLFLFIDASFLLFFDTLSFDLLCFFSSLLAAYFISAPADDYVFHFSWYFHYFLMMIIFRHYMPFFIVYIRHFSAFHYFSFSYFYHYFYYWFFWWWLPFALLFSLRLCLIFEIIFFSRLFLLHLLSLFFIFLIFRALSFFIFILISLLICCLSPFYRISCHIHRRYSFIFFFLLSFSSLIFPLFRFSLLLLISRLSSYFLHISLLLFRFPWFHTAFRLCFITPLLFFCCFSIAFGHYFSITFDFWFSPPHFSFLRLIRFPSLLDYAFIISIWLLLIIFAFSFFFFIFADDFLSLFFRFSSFFPSVFLFRLYIFFIDTFFLRCRYFASSCYASCQVYFDIDFSSFSFERYFRLLLSFCFALIWYYSFDLYIISSIDFIIY